MQTWKNDPFASLPSKKTLRFFVYYTNISDRPDIVNDKDFLTTPVALGDVLEILTLFYLRQRTKTSLTVHRTKF